MKRRDFVIEFVFELFDATDFLASAYCIWYLAVFSRISFVSRAVDFVRLLLQLIDVAQWGWPCLYLGVLELSPHKHDFCREGSLTFSPAPPPLR